MYSRKKLLGFLIAFSTFYPVSRSSALDVLPCNPTNDSMEQTGKAINSALGTVQRLGSCELFPSDGAKQVLNGLSPLWAQELIGADLAKERLSNDANTTTVPFGTFESVDLTSMDKKALSPKLLSCRNDFTQPGCKALEVTPAIRNKQIEFFHGDEVANLVADPVVGAAGNAQLAVSLEADPPGVDVIKLSNAMIQAQVKLLCSSVDNNLDNLNQALSSLHNHGVINVEAAENFYPRSTPSYNKNGDVIVVGSLSPTGLTSGFSESGDSVTISAPSDTFVQSKDQGTFQTFGGTSGAQPLVCGSIANVISLLPGVTSEEMKTILKNTALNLSSGYKSRSGENSMVNAYKMVRVAERLRNGWPQDRSQISGDAKLFDFTDEAQKSLTDGEKLVASHDSCQEKQGIDDLRSAFLLNPENATARTDLVKVYLDNGLSWNAKFIQSTGGMSLDDVRELLKSKDPGTDQTAIRHLGDFGKASEPDLNKILTSLSPTSTAFFGTDTSGYTRDGIAEGNATLTATAAMALKRAGDPTSASLLLLNMIEKTDSKPFISTLFYNLKGSGVLTAPILNACFSSKASDPYDCSEDALSDLGAKGAPLIGDNLVRIDIGDLGDVAQTLLDFGPMGKQVLQKHLNDAQLSPAARQIIQSALNEAAVTH